MAGKKVDATLATGIGLDVEDAVTSIDKLKNSVKDSTQEWKQMESTMKRSGDEIGASKAKYEGLSKSIDEQQNVLNELKKQQSEVNRETKAGEDTYQKYQTQITQAERQLTSMTAQQEKAKRAYELQESGINALNKEIQQNIKETDAQVERLKAEGKETEANDAQKKGLSKTLEKQSELYQAQVKELDKMTKSGEASSDSISKQKIALDKTATAIAQGKKSLAELDEGQTKFGKNKGADEASNKMEGFKGKIGKSKEALVAMGATATAVLGAVAKAVDKAYDAQSQVNELQAKTTMDYKQSKESLLAINKLYADGYGESVDELQDVYTKIEQLHPEFTVKQLADNTKLVSTYAKMSGADVDEVMQGADKATRNWNISYEEYFDKMMTLQKMGDDQSGDISDNMAEYSQVLGQMGLSISDSMALIDNGVKSGAYNGDKLLDFTKEFQISLNDGRMDEAITSFSKKSQDMFKGYKEGKVTAGDMFKQITGEMGNMTDKQKEATIASNLWSALGEDNSLKVIGSLGKTNWAFDNVKGTAKKTADQLKESNPFELMKRGAEESINSISLNAAETKNFKKALKPLQQSISNFIKQLLKNLPKIMQALTPIVNFAATHGKTIAALGTTIASAFVFTKAIKGVTSLVSTFKELSKVGKIMMAGGGIIGAVILIGSALVDLYQHNKKFHDFVNNIVEACKDFAKAAIKWFGNAFDAVGDFFKNIGKSFSNGGKNIQNFTKSVGKWFKGIGQSIGDETKSIGKSLSNVGKSIGNWFKGIGKSIGNGVDAVGDWFSGLAKGFKKGWDAFLKTAIKIAKGFGRAMIIALAFPVGLAMIITKPLIKPLQNIFNTLIKDVKVAWNGLTKFLKTIWTPVQKVWMSAWNAISKFFSTTWKVISKVFTGYLNQVKKNLTTVLSFISKTWNKSWNAISKFFSNVWKTIEKAFNKYLDNFKNNLNDALKFISKIWNKNWKAISDFFDKVWDGIKKFFTPIIKWLHSIISSTINAISKTWNNVWGKISRFFSNTWKSMKETGHDAIWSIKNTFDSVLGKIHDAFSNTWKKIKDGFKSMWDGMKQLAQDGINAVIKIPNKGIDGINGLIHDFGGPKHAIGKIPKVKFANGTGAIDKLTHAVLNDGNDSPETGNKETIIHPNGKMEVVQGINTERLLLPGTEVLNAKETAMMMGLQGIKHFAGGTGFWSHIKGFAGDVGHIAGNAWNGLKNGVKKFTEMFKFITNAVAHPVKTMEGVFNPKAKGLPGIFTDIGSGFFKNAKKQAQGWWKTLWSMADESSNSGASAGMKGDDYRYKNRVADSGNGDPWGYFFKECVSFVASRLANLGVPASKFSHLGNGRDWVNAPVRHTSKPRPGMVAVYSNGSQFGNHVAMVTGVQGGKISGEEYNWNLNHAYHQYHGRPASGATTFLDFGLSGSSAAPEVKASSPLAKLIKRQTGGMMKWIQKFIAPLNEESGEPGGGTQALPSGSHKHWLEQAGIHGNFDKWNYIINHESGWNPRAQNPSSSAYGIGQALPPSKMAAFGSDYMSNPITQLKWMKSYVGDRYGGIDGAYKFWRSHNWYENGGIINQDSIIRVAERNMPEMVIPLAAEKKSRAKQLLNEANERINGKTDDESLMKQLIELVKRWQEKQGNQGDTYEININVNADTTPATLRKIQQAVEDAITRKQSAKARAFGG